MLLILKKKGWKGRRKKKGTKMYKREKLNLVVVTTISERKAAGGKSEDLLCMTHCMDKTKLGWSLRVTCCWITTRVGGAGTKSRGAHNILCEV